RSSALAAPGVRGGGSSGRITRMACSSCATLRFGRPGPDLGLLSYGRFFALGDVEQAFFFSARLDICSRPAIPRPVDNLSTDLSTDPSPRPYVQTRARRRHRQFP